MTDVRPARTAEYPGVMNVLDGALLDVQADVRARIDADDVLVAVDDGPIIGALVLVPDDDDATYVDAVAVRRTRRASGVGTALVERAADRERTLIADFDDSVRAFYEKLGFEIEPRGDGRCRGVLR